MLEGEHAVAAGECHPMAEVPFAGRGRFESEHGDTDESETTSASAQANSRPGAVLVPTRTRTPTMASFSTEFRLPRHSWAEPRCSPIAALSKVSAPIVATDPITKRAAVVESAPMILRLSPRNGERASVASDRIRTARHEMYIPVLTVTRRSAGRQRVEFGQQEERDPESTDRSEKECRRGCGGRQAHIPRREQTRGDGPIGEAEYRRGPLLGHQVGEGREESPQSWGLRLRFRVLRLWFGVLRRAAPAVPRNARATPTPGNASRGILRGRRAGPRPPSAVPWRLSDPQPFTSPILTLSFPQDSGAMRCA